MFLLGFSFRGSLLYQEGKVIEYTVEPENQNVVFTLSSGITYVYQNKIAGTDSAALADKDISVITCQPCKSGYPSSISKYMSYPDEAAKYFADAFENINFTSNLDDSAVTRETLKSFSSNQIILWHGHGGYSNTLHSFIVLGEKKDTSTESSQDYIEQRIILSTDDDIMATYKFVDAYCGDMTNTLFYIGCCNSGKDGVLATSFLKKGCTTVIGNSNTICTTYNLSMIRSFSKYLAKEKKFLWFSLGYRNAFEALKEAKGDNGKYCCKKNKATPLIFGSSSYMLKDAVEKEVLETGTEGFTEDAGSISLDKSYIGLTAGESATVAIQSYPTGYTDSDFIWSVDDTSIASVSGGTVTGISKGNTILTVTSKDGLYVQSCAIIVK